MVSDYFLFITIVFLLKIWAPKGQRPLGAVNLLYFIDDHEILTLPLPKQTDKLENKLGIWSSLAIRSQQWWNTVEIRPSYSN